jgi:hypothetical protein
MQALLKVFWDIALWRRGPRDVPASPGLLALAALAYAGTSAVESWLIDGEPLAIARALVDLAFTAATMWLCLAVRRRLHRLPQTLTAVLGTGTLLALPVIAVFVVAAAVGPEGPVAAAVKLLLLPLLVWELAVLANIVRQALEAPLVAGVAVATTYYLVGYLLVERLVPAAVG